MASRRGSTVTRACDSCRMRKVKCDASEDCSNCRLSGLPCQYTSARRKRGPKVTRAPRAIEKARQATPNAYTPALEDRLPSNEGPMFPPTPSIWADSQGQQGHEDLTPSFSGTEIVPTTESAGAIRDSLVQSMNCSIPSIPALNVINLCIELYMKYTFPTAPCVHEPTLQASANKFFAEDSSAQLFGTGSWGDKVVDMRAFTLLTAVCASVASVLPKSLLPYQEAVAEPCLKASRNMLKVFEDFDIEHPCATSIISRSLHSTALQQITGKSALAYHILGQATLLLQTMRLYREDALSSHNALQAQLLRNAFWQLFAADKASACLGSRPFVLHEMLFGEELTLRLSGETMVPLMSTSSPWFEETLEGKILLGFHFIPRLWSTAASLLSDIKAYGGVDEGAEMKTRLIQDYVVFSGILDELPQWLQTSSLIVCSEDGRATQCQRTMFWVQRCTIMVTYQCLRLVILQQCINSKAWDIIGLNGLALTIAMAKIGIIYDFIQTLEDIPFVYLQVKGEPTVQRIRVVGSVLLEMTFNPENETIQERAKNYFVKLLDILGRLDSKASDEMSSWQP
ncbi:hypothetical protein V499_08010 [Pseudogymnoascus sp. VKM F-103]|nr:hypothetical protein V499_08010 [Pseudogymnoascus sp. VKM F-103]